MLFFTTCYNMNLKEVKLRGLTPSFKTFSGKKDSWNCARLLRRQLLKQKKKRKGKYHAFQVETRQRAGVSTATYRAQASKTVIALCRETYPSPSMRWRTRRPTPPNSSICVALARNIGCGLPRQLQRCVSRRATNTGLSVHLRSRRTRVLGQSVR